MDVFRRGFIKDRFCVYLILQYVQNIAIYLRIKNVYMNDDIEIQTKEKENLKIFIGYDRIFLVYFIRIFSFE